MTYKFYHIIKDFPTLTQDLVDEVYWSINHCKNVFIDPNHKSYKQFLVSYKLKDFTSSFVKEDHFASIQVINEGLPIHIDFYRQEAFNYIIEQGGDNTTTRFYDLNDFNKVGNKLQQKNTNIESIEQVVIPKHQWHKLDVTVPHNVTDIETTRISLSINRLKR